MQVLTWLVLHSGCSLQLTLRTSKHLKDSLGNNDKPYCQGGVGISEELEYL